MYIPFNFSGSLKGFYVLLLCLKVVSGSLKTFKQAFYYIQAKIHTQ
ncbi:MAG: hypothetical protein J6T41_07175 [Neisseriaceae bacterium]|nr:hypothetical protein [Neisseriaceae bacterium]